MHRLSAGFFLGLGLAVGLAGRASEASAQLSIGVRAGASFSRIEDLSLRDRYTGYTLGGYLTVPISGLSILTGAALVQRGGGIRNASGEVAFNANYLEIPVLLRATIGSPRGVAAHLLGGVSAAFQRKCNLSLSEGKGSGECEGLLSTARLTRDLKKSDMSLVGGVGAQFPVFVGAVLGAEILYVRGMRNVFAEGDDAEFKHRGFVAQAGIAFAF